MSRPIEDYALLSDCRCSALVAKDGSIDWMCAPRFDSDSVFARLLGSEEHGFWRIRPCGGFRVNRRYVDDTMVLQTRFLCDEGEVLLEDALSVGASTPMLVRSLRGLRGRVRLELSLVLRPDYGSTIPWVRPTGYGLKAIAGPDEWNLQSPVQLDGREMTSTAAFTVNAGERLDFALSWQPSHASCYSPCPDLPAELAKTCDHWRRHAARCIYRGPYGDAVARSILTLKALIYEPTGAIIAAPTTSLPEHFGGARNWDYRYCWLRDSTFSFDALMLAGYEEEARRWIDWMMKAVAGSPAQAHMLYGVEGERRLVESELPWLPGYENSRPVRVGNAAYGQVQMDVFGQVIDTLHEAVRNEVPTHDDAWRIQKSILDHLQRNWDEPDAGIWEIRGACRHFTHSKVMAWVAVDRAIRNARMLTLDAPLQDWERLRDRIHADVCRRGYSPRRRAFVQSYDSEALDASLLLLPILGFLPADDPRITGTVRAIESELMDGRYVRRYDPSVSDDGVGGGEGVFIACSFWLADAWILMGRRDEATELFEHLLSLRNDLGLLSEEYDPRRRRLAGNFPQAFSHIALVNTAFTLQDAGSTLHSECTPPRRGTATAAQLPRWLYRTEATMPDPVRHVVITGASAGVGRVAAQEFAREGARLSLIARSEAGLAAAAHECRGLGAEVATFCADVGDEQQLNAAAEAALERFGPFDVWVNNAMATVVSPVVQMTPAEFRRVTDVTYLGAVYGTLAALKSMRERNRGVVIQVGSALAYRSIPLQSAYCAAKHALLGFTESLRTELLHDRCDVHLTLVHLPAVNTPQFNWALNRMPKRPQPVPPVFQPEMVARVIVRASSQRRREWFVGFPTFKAVWADKLVPQVADWYLARTGFASQQSAEPEDTQRPCNLWDPMPDEYYTGHGRFDEIASTGSTWQMVNQYRWIALGIVLAVAVGLVLLLD